MKFREFINWRTENITVIELFLFMSGFGLIGLGLGGESNIYAFLGLGNVIGAQILLLCRLATIRRRK